jgi:hypothetical protein
MKPTLLLAAFAGCVASLCAQAPEPPAVIQISREVIKEGKGAAHSRTEQAEVNAFRKNKFPFHYLALSTISGPNEVLFLEAYPSFAAVEQGYQEADKAPLKSEFEQAEARDGELHAAVDRKQTGFIKLRLANVQSRFLLVVITNHKLRSKSLHPTGYRSSVVCL